MLRWRRKLPQAFSERENFSSHQATGKRRQERRAESGTERQELRAQVGETGPRRVQDLRTLVAFTDPEDGILVHTPDGGVKHSLRNS
ncbi:hypothetical protein E2320_020939 [Naja naja]|nr:hypothetical protein E2320_020939 [Naja naja]